MSMISLAKNRRFSAVFLALAVSALLIFSVAGHSHAQGPQQLELPKKTTIQLTTNLVTNTDDSGDGSLRNAIESANVTNGTVIISFEIPCDGPHTITPASPLPGVGSGVLINGYTKDGSVKATATSPALLKIELNGTVKPKTSIRSSQQLHLLLPSARRKH